MTQNFGETTDVELLGVYTQAAPFLAMLGGAHPFQVPTPGQDRDKMYWNAGQASLVQHHLSEAERLGVKIPLDPPVSQRYLCVPLPKSKPQSPLLQLLRRCLLLK